MISRQALTNGLDGKNSFALSQKTSESCTMGTLRLAVQIFSFMWKLFQSVRIWKNKKRFGWNKIFDNGWSQSNNEDSTLYCIEMKMEWKKDSRSLATWSYRKRQNGLHCVHTIFQASAPSSGAERNLQNFKSRPIGQRVGSRWVICYTYPSPPDQLPSCRPRLYIEISFFFFPSSGFVSIVCWSGLRRRKGRADGRRS